MIRRYCDCCGQEVDHNCVFIKGRSVVGGQEVQVELQVGTGLSLNTGEICGPCVAQAVLKLLTPPERERACKLVLGQVEED